MRVRPEPLSPHRRRRWIGGVFAALLLVGTVACTSSSDSTSVAAEDYGAARPAGSAPAAPATEAPSVDVDERPSAEASASRPSVAPTRAPDASGGTDSGGGSDPKAPVPTKQPAEPNVLDGRQIIRTGSFSMDVTVPKTDDPEADQKALVAKVNDISIKIRAAATGVGGFVSASEGDGRTQSITLRVPVAKYDATRAALAGLGPMTGSENSEDVTAAVADMEGRIATLKKAIERIRALLANAERVQDIIAIEAELSQREADLEALMRKRAAMADQVALSTITMVVAGKVVSGPVVKRPDVPDVRVASIVMAKPGGFTGGVLAVAAMLKDIGSGLLTFAGVLLPLLPIGLLVIAVILWWVRRRRRTLPAAYPHPHPLTQRSH